MSGVDKEWDDCLKGESGKAKRGSIAELEQNFSLEEKQENPETRNNQAISGFSSELKHVNYAVLLLHSVLLSTSVCTWF